MRTPGPSNSPQDPVSVLTVSRMALISVPRSPTLDPCHNAKASS